MLFLKQTGIFCCVTGCLSLIILLCCYFITDVMQGNVVAIRLFERKTEYLRCPLGQKCSIETSACFWVEGDNYSKCIEDVFQIFHYDRGPIQVGDFVGLYSFARKMCYSGFGTTNNCPGSPNMISGFQSYSLCFQCEMWKV